jgi:hypothetical protein
VVEDGVEVTTVGVLMGLIGLLSGGLIASATIYPKMMRGFNHMEAILAKHDIQIDSLCKTRIEDRDLNQRTNDAMLKLVTSNGDIVKTLVTQNAVLMDKAIEHKG